MHSSEIVTTLSTLLSNGLPGKVGQLSLYSENRKTEYQKIKDHFTKEHTGKETKLSSVLFLLYVKEQKLFTALIKRPDYEGVHGGQISFPGGKREDTDQDEFHTALREANEEIGIQESSVTIIGKLSPVYIPPSHFQVEVIVGYSSDVPKFKIDTFEVEKVLNVPIYHFLNPLNYSEKEVVRTNGWAMKAPGFIVDDFFIWGATSMMISEFIFHVQNHSSLLPPPFQKLIEP